MREGYCDRRAAPARIRPVSRLCATIQPVPEPTPRAILHVDMDAFYASVEQRDQPALRGRPVIVGGHPQRGVVLAASYQVRPFGVRSAMPMARAVRLAPQAIVVPPRFPAYAAASAQVFALFESVTPLVEPLSLDEAFLDVTGSQRLFGAPAQIAAMLRRRIAAEVGLPASAGIAPVKFVAKIASDLAKPNGQREVPAAEVLDFLAPLPVARLWGVGPKTQEVLHSMGLRTVGQIAARGRAALEARLGDLGRHLHALSQGQDERQVVPDRQAQSIGTEDTFAADTDDEEALRGHIHQQALRVGARLRRAGLLARCVQLKLKYSDHAVVTRRVTLDPATDDGQRLYEAAAALLSRAQAGRLVRLTGVSGQELVPPAAQLDLFQAPAARRGKLNAALDEISRRFGSRAVVPADLADATDARTED